MRDFDGREGRRCYFAFQGKVYDAGDSPMWRNGEHMRRHEAGRDLTGDLPLAPHDAAVLERLPVVGTYEAEGRSGQSLSTRTFYVVAHMNLAIVLLILLILALWRWG